MPDLKDYYSTTILTQLKEWFLPFPNSLWGELEHAAIPYDSIKLWLLSRQTKMNIPIYLPPTIKASVLAWKKLITYTWRETPSVN